MTFDKHVRYLLLQENCSFWLRFVHKLDFAGENSLMGKEKRDISSLFPTFDTLHAVQNIFK